MSYSIIQPSFTFNFRETQKPELKSYYEWFMKVRSKRRAISLTVVALACLGCGVQAPASQSPARGSGRLPPAEIQRVVRGRFDRFQACYHAGLTRDPHLEGRVSVKFVIEPDGSISNIAPASPTMPDQKVVECVVKSFRGLQFPAPQKGIVTVTYPLIFSPFSPGETLAPPGFFAGCSVTEPRNEAEVTLIINCKSRMVSVLDLTVRPEETMARRSQSIFEGQFPISAHRQRTTPTFNGEECWMTAVDLPEISVSMLLAPMAPASGRRVACGEVGTRGTSPWCARALEIFTQPRPAKDLLSTPAP